MKRFWDDAYAFSFESKIRDVVKGESRVTVILEETCFFPEGGGQPADRGTLAGHPVLDVQEQGHGADEIVLHFLAAEAWDDPAIRAGASVQCEIEREFRLHNMRLHSACHLLFGAAHRMFPEVAYAGFNIGEIGNLYLGTDRQIRGADLREMARLANEAVVEDRPIHTSFVDSRDARQMSELVHNLELPEGSVRVVNVEGWDFAACSGTHLRRTIEVGPIRILARASHKKNVTRLDYAVGKRAVADMVLHDQVVDEAAEMLSTGKDQIGQAIRKLTVDLSVANKTARKLREALVEFKAREMATAGETVGHVRLVVEAVDYLDADSVRALVNRIIAGGESTVAAVVAGDDKLSVAAGRTDDLNLNLSAPVVRVAKAHGGGGGGRPNLVTAGGLSGPAQAVRDELAAALRDLLTTALPASQAPGGM